MLLSGCRCVEIDVWDGRPAGEEKEDSTGGAEDGRGLRQRFGLSRSGSPKASPGTRAGESPSRGFRERLGLKKKDLTTAPTDGSSQPEASAESGELKAPAPWTANANRQVEPRVLHGKRIEQGNL